MEAERWQRINDLFLTALEREPAGRSAFINEACAGDNELRREVESLLAAHEDAPEFIEEPVVGAAARLLADEHAGSMTGRQISHYQIISLLGAGGMGEVYLAEDTRLRRRVALKILSQDIATDRERLLRFEREAFAASALNHPNILTIHEFGAEGKTHFLVSELVQGETVRDRINRATLTLTESLNIALQIASALQAAHDAGIIHRDIKPENVMIRDDGYVKVLDFGLAKLSEGFPAARSDSSEELARSQLQTQAGIIMGTAAYMSPEQARGNEIDARSDIWSLGCVLYEMLTIQQPFGGETVTDTLANIIHSEPASILSIRYDAPAELEHIVMKMLHKSRDQRYQAIKNLHADLKQLHRRLEFEGELKPTSSPDRQEAKSPVINPQTSASAEARNSIAVLPFANLTADPENEYFCDGLAEELLNALAKVDDLKVAARTSAFFFKGKQTNISDIGRALRVNTVLEGSVRRSGNRIRISVQLINASDGFHIWSERYDREMKDIFAVQDEITLSLVAALKLKLLVREKALKRYTDNPEAYELYLQGRYHYQKYSPDGLFKAKNLFERAIEIEPAYAPAYASLASVLAFAWYFSLLPANETLAKVEAATLRALEIDEGIEEAHVALGRYKFYFEWNWAEAEREFLRAIELNSEDPESRQQYAVILAALGRSDEAIKQASKALELDPLSLLVNLQIGWVYLVLGRSDDTLQLVRKMLEMEPGFHGAYWQMGWALYAQGRMEESLEAYRKAESLGTYPVVTARVGVVYAELGKRDEAIAVLDRLLEMRKRRPIASLCIAQVYSALGDFDNAFEWLEKSVHERDGELVFLNGTLAPNIRGNVGQAIRKDPRFQGILQRVGLPGNEPGRDKTNEKSQPSTVIFNTVEYHGS